MEHETRNHLENAKRNQEFATVLFQMFLDSDAQETSTDQPSELLWCVVVAFYSAVHYVNAYLWERHRFSPSNHATREHRIYSDPELTRIAVSYDTLKGWGLQARYDPLARISDADAQVAIDDLFQISELITRELRSHRNH